MRVTIDGAGRLVIPKALRDALGLAPGIPLEIRVRNGRIEIQPATTPMRLRRRGKGLVATSEEPLPTLTAGDVRSVTESIRLLIGPA